MGLSVKSVWWCAFSLALALSSAVPAPAATVQGQGAEDAPVPAVDEDFALQGEYSGTVSNPGSGAEPVGLQVVALGGGQFQATEFRGGLPGAGWDWSTRSAFTGSRKDDVVTLSGTARKITLRGGRAWIWDGAGQRLGELQRVARRSSMEGTAPPAGAVVLFNGTRTNELQGGRVTDDGLLMVGTDTKKTFGDCVTTRPYGDCYLHLEFRTPYVPEKREQGRGNSGVYIQGRYEVQILEAFGFEPKFNEAASLYRTRSPDANMSFPPRSWQTYDINFRAPRFDACGQKIANACITVIHNGVIVHNNVEIPNKTGGGKVEGPEPLPLKLQDHRNPIEFRNIWIIDYGSPQPGQSELVQYNTAENCLCRRCRAAQCRACRRCR